MTDRTALAVVSRASRRVAQATVDRDAGIRNALAAGFSLREVAEAAGLSHTAIAKIRDR